MAARLPGSGRGVPRDPEPRKLDRGAAVHDDLEPRVTCARGGRVVDHAELQPDGAGADRDRLVDVLARRLGASEDVDDVHVLLDLRDAREGALAENALAV